MGIESRAVDDALVAIARRLGPRLAREAVEEASDRARAALVERLTESLLAAGAASLAEPVPAREPEPTPKPEAASPEPAPKPGAASDDRPPPGDACYVFAITPAGGAAPDGLVGLDGVTPLIAVAGGPLAAIACDIDPRLLEGVADEPFGPDSRLAGLAARHDEVVRALFDRGPVLPLRFGTVLTSRAAAATTLARGRERFLGELARVEGAVEWTCRVRRRDDAVSADAPREPASSGGARYLAQRDADLRRVEEADERLRAAAERLESAARSVAVASVPLGSARDEVRAAFLVPIEGGRAFADAVSAVRSSARDDGVDVEAAGPLPPYHFVHIELEAGPRGSVTHG